MTCIEQVRTTNIKKCERHVVTLEGVVHIPSLGLKYRDLKGLAAKVDLMFGKRQRGNYVPSTQPAGLISVLLDQSAPFGDRDDAAMDLAAFDEPEALHALERVADDPATDRELVESCSDSLVEIRQRSAGTG